ncbi:MAG: hypothetical protein IIY21_03120 [Clostridiales bacterium]|nr:hypothetical protein [Clostridiales bacterium]MBQ1570303.1 hypothetical protein [Clostridiales bacterium]
MKDFYKELLTETDDISESKSLDGAVFSYGVIWGRVALARELKLISADQMSHIQKTADEALENWKTFFL